MNKRWLVLLVLILFLFFRIYQNEGIHSEFSGSEENTLSIFINLPTNISKIVNNNLPSPEAQLLSGMLLGIKSDLPKDFKDQLTNTSTIHIVVVSGQNLSLVAGFAMGLGPVFGKKKTILFSFLVTLAYCLLTGFQIPVIRAAIMVLLTGLATIFDKQKQTAWILAVTVLAMLSFNPNWLLSISFQLSVLATIGAAMVAPNLAKKLNFLPSIIKEDFAVSLAAQALTWPVIAWNFHQFSLIGIIANIFVLWTVSFIMILGTLGIVLAFLIPFFAKFFFLPASVLLTYFVYMINFFGNLPYASIKVGDLSILFWVGYYILLLGLFLSFGILTNNKVIDKTIGSSLG